MLDKILEFADILDSSELAKILISLEPGVGDRGFLDHPPVIQVHAFPERYSDAEIAEVLSEPKAIGTYISVNAPEALRTILYPMPYKEKRTNTSKSEKMPPSRQIWVLAVPDGDWKDIYDSTWIPVRVRRGNTVFLPISLRRSQPGGSENMEYDV